MACTGITRSNYFVKNLHAPFTQAGSQVWLGAVWNFDGTHLPVFGTTTDNDDDGISSAVEDAAPNGGDANDDDTADSQQANVSALVDPFDEPLLAAVAVNNACDLSDVGIQSESSLGNDSSFTYPMGQLNIHGRLAARTASPPRVTQYYYNPPSGNFVLRKYVNGSSRPSQELLSLGRPLPASRCWW
ncbi:MAG: hypothetical protein WDN27_05100 [Candidatus Saccharibacteria bacterium]